MLKLAIKNRLKWICNVAPRLLTSDVRLKAPFIDRFWKIRSNKSEWKKLMREWIEYKLLKRRINDKILINMHWLLSREDPKSLLAIHPLSRILVFWRESCRMRAKSWLPVRCYWLNVSNIYIRYISSGFKKN